MSVMKRAIPVILTWACVLMCCIPAAAKRTYIDSINSICDSSFTVSPPGNSGWTRLDLRFRLKKDGGNLSISFATPDSGIIAIIIEPRAEWHEPAFSGSRCLVKVTSSRAGAPVSSLVAKCPEDVKLSPAGYLTLSLTVSRHSLEIEAGAKKVARIAELSGAFTPSAPMTVGAEGKCDFEYIVTESRPDMALLTAAHHPPERLASLYTAAPPEGVYTYLDRDTDSRRALLGGRYTLGVIANSSGSYDIIYLSGATVNPEDWKSGMKKGELTPTIFANHFDLKWMTSTMRHITLDCHADIEQDAILTLSFPLLKSKIRFARVMNPPAR